MKYNAKRFENFCLRIDFRKFEFQHLQMLQILRLCVAKEEKYKTCQKPKLKKKVRKKSKNDVQELYSEGETN